MIAAFWMALILAFAAQPAAAHHNAEHGDQTAAAMPIAASATTAPTPAPAVIANDAATDSATGDEAVADTSQGYTPMVPTKGKGMPVPGGWQFQDQYSVNGEYALWMHNVILMPLITAICLLVLGLLLWVVVRYRKGKQPVPSKTTHNTVIEVIWTLVPVFVLVGIAIPSITLLARQFESPPEDAITIKTTGYQWYWGYTYPDNGGFEVISNMLPEQADAQPGARYRTDADGPSHLAVDNRMVVPVGVPLRIQTTAADVIHSFAVPSLWFKLDAVPGRLNERLLIIEEPGVYFGQCSELCGARHGYMPIAVEALPMDKWKQWVREQGGTFPDEEAAAAAAGTPADAKAAESAAPAETDSATPVT